MIKTILVLLFLTSALLAKIDICVSIPPQAFFVKQIAGEHADVTVLIPPGSSPATFTPRPSQLRAIKKASIYFTIGVPFEHNWLERFRSIHPDLQIVDMTEGIEKLPMHDSLHEEAHHEDAHHHGSLDPHVWLSPMLVKKMAAVIKETLAKADPAHAKAYDANYRKFLDALDRLHAQIAERLKPLKQRTFIVFHPSFGYFAREFGLRQVAIEKEGKEPSLHYIGRIIDFARQNRIRTIFVEPQFSQKSARYIANKIGGKVVAIDPLAYDWDSNLMKVAESFEKAD